MKVGYKTGFCTICCTASANDDDRPGSDLRNFKLFRKVDGNEKKGFSGLPAALASTAVREIYISLMDFLNIANSAFAISFCSAD